MFEKVFETLMLIKSCQSFTMFLNIFLNKVRLSLLQKINKVLLNLRKLSKGLPKFIEGSGNFLGLLFEVFVS